MPYKGQLLANPLTGDTFEFLETAKDTNGERVVIKATVKRKGELVPNHFHVLQDESFEILAGKLTVWQNGEVKEYAGGSKIMLRKNEAHNHYNADDEPVTYIHTTSPAYDFDYFFENLVNLSIQGKDKGFVQRLVTLKYMDSKAYLSDKPLIVQKVLMNIVAPLARIFGYKAFYKEYCGMDK